MGIRPRRCLQRGLQANNKCYRRRSTQRRCRFQARRKAECVKYCIRTNRESPHGEGGDCPKNFVCMMEGLQEYQKKKDSVELNYCVHDPHLTVR